MFYVYEWFNIENGYIFYVGKGTGKRYLHTKKRNKLFKKYYDNNSCNTRIIKNFSNELDAFKYENDRIIELKKVGQCSCNLDNGGKGGVNFIWTDEMRKYKSEFNPMKEQHQRDRMKKNNPMKNKDIANKVNSKKCRQVIIKGILFKSTKLASEYFGRHPEQIQFWCKRGYDSDKEPCRYADEPQKKFELKISNSKKVIIDNIKFNSITEASKHYGVWAETIIRAIKNNRTFKGHTCKYDNQQPSQENFDNSILEGSETRE